MLLTLLAAAFPDPAVLGHPEYRVRAEAHAALSSPLGAVVAWAHRPASPEAAWRRSRIVADWSPWERASRACLGVLLLRLAADETYILRDPVRFCAMIDGRPGLFFAADSYAWAAAVPPGDPTYTIERDLIRVAQETVRRWTRGDR